MLHRFFTSALLLSAAVVIGCGDGPGPGVEVDGKYHLRSSIQTVRGIPELESPELHAFVRLADHPDRVEEWILDRLLDQVSEPYRTALEALRRDNDVEEEMRKYLSIAAPTFRTSLVELAQETKRLTQSVNLHSEIELVSYGDGDSGMATHRFTGMWFELGSDEVRVDFGEVGATDAITTVGGFDVQRNGDELIISFADQSANVPYGRTLSYVLNEVLVEIRDPFADSLADLVSSTVPCSDIGRLLEILIDTGSNEIYAVACTAIFGELSKAVLPKEMGPMNLTLSIEGDAVLVEGDDSNRRVDGFELGEWEGSLAYPSTAITLRRPDHVFVGDRDPSPRNNVEP